MSPYQKEQLDAFNLILRYLSEDIAEKIAGLHRKISDYLAFRKEVNTFLKDNFSNICTQSCYTSRRSACCTKEGIITFFAEMVINVLSTETEELSAVLSVLKAPHSSHKCVYLGKDGCLWRIKPLVCEMFLCDQAEDAVFSKNEALRSAWLLFKEREKSFRWPDKPVLFDDIEKIFLDTGYSSPLMYLHNSPGLLRVKKMHAGLKRDPDSISKKS